MTAIATPRWARTLAGLLSIAFVLPLGASTEVIFGTIVKGTEGGSRFSILAEMFNYTGRGEGRVMTKDIPKQTLIYLDGQESTAAEAIVAGRAVMYLDDGKFILVSSQSPGPDANRQASDAATAIHRLDIANALVLPLKGKRGTSDEEVGIELVLDVVDGKVIDGVAVYRVSTWPNVDIDVSGLTYANGAVTGTTTVTIDHPAVQRDAPVTTQLTISTDGADKRKDGTCAVAVDGTETTAGFTRQVLTRTDPTPDKVWMRLGAPGAFFRDHVFVVFPLLAGKGQTDGHHWYHKGKINGSIEENGITLDQGKLAGTLQSQVVAGGASGGDRVPHSFTIDARVLGGRYVFGTLSLTVGEATHQGFVRGGLVPTDCPVGGITAELAQTFAERFPKKKKSR